MCPCNKFPKNKIYDKHRLEVDSHSEKFLKMAKNRLDSGADLYYHSTCMRNYLQKTKDNSVSMSNSNELAHTSCQALDKVVASLTPTLLSRTGFTLSKVRDKFNIIIHPNQIHSYQVKSFLRQKLGEGIKFCPSI